MMQLFDSEARRNQVYPLTPGSTPHPLLSGNTTTFVYRPGVERVHPAAAPQLGGRRHSIIADVDIPAGGAEGVILAEGGRYGGFTLFLKDGRVVYSVNAFGNEGGTVTASEPLTPGKSHIQLDFEPDPAKSGRAAILGSPLGPGKATLSVNGKTVGEAPIANFGGYYFETLDVGSDLGTPVSTAYKSPFQFTGQIDTVKLELR
jgi:hypothetical protein